MNKLAAAILILSLSSVSAQTDWKRWEPAEVEYAKPAAAKVSRIFNSVTFTNAILSGFQFVYGYAISDVDGDNCPFSPTCSSFFVQSVKRTNFAQGLLMFADRFTRDSNIFKQYSYYPVLKNRHFYDPIDLYIWSADKKSVFGGSQKTNK